MVDHETIWLEAKCREDGNNGREWCQDDVWGDDCGCDEGGHKPTKYIRADLATPTPPGTQDAVERVLKECAAELAEFFFPASPPYRSKEAMAEDMTLVIARHFRAALAASGHGKGGEG